MEFDDLIIKKKMLEQLRFGIAQAFHERELDDSVFVAEIGRFMAQGIMAKLSVHYPAEEIINYRAPASPWQAFKLRFFPAWLRDLYPVREEVFRVMIIHPDIKIKHRTEEIYYAVLHKGGIREVQDQPTERK